MLFIAHIHSKSHHLYYDVFDNQHEVPAIDTEYYCSFHNPPKLDSKHHVISVSKIKTIFATYFKHFTESAFYPHCDKIVVSSIQMTDLCKETDHHQT